MPYRSSAGSAGFVFHVLNRAAKRARIFAEDRDYLAFLGVMAEAQARIPLRILAYCVMPNHFHLVVWPSADGEVSRYMHWLTGTHGRRWNVSRGTVGQGCVYQSRFKAFAVQTDRHFLTVCRYVEQNPLRAGLCRTAQEWPWSSLGDQSRQREPIRLHDWPTPRPSNWLSLVNETPSASTLKAVRHAIRRGAPLGAPAWVAATTATLDLGRGGERRGT